MAEGAHDDAPTARPLGLLGWPRTRCVRVDWWRTGAVKAGLGGAQLVPSLIYIQNGEESFDSGASKRKERRATTSAGASRLFIQR